MTATSSTTTTTSTQPPYTDDTDLTDLRSNILGLGITDLSTQHDKARAYVNRDLEAGWYRQAAKDEAGKDYRTYPFNPSLLLDTSQVTDAATYKALELTYEKLSKDQGEDSFRTQADRYRKRYEKEIKRVILAGLHYDWDADNVLEEEERSVQRRSRRLSRA